MLTVSVLVETSTRHWHANIEQQEGMICVFQVVVKVKQESLNTFLKEKCPSSMERAGDSGVSFVYYRFTLIVFY